jgi:hypothetical protein
MYGPVNTRDNIVQAISPDDNPAVRTPILIVDTNKR